VLGIVGGIGRDPEILREARERAERYLVDPGSIEPTLSAAVLALAAETGDTALYEKFLAKAKAAEGPQEYYRFLYQLPGFTEPALVARTLEYAVSPEVRSLIGGLMSKPASRTQAWQFVKSNWSALEKALGTFQGIPGIVASTGSFCESAARADVEAFFKAHPVPAAERALQQALEAIAIFLRPARVYFVPLSRTCPCSLGTPARSVSY
jgi:aminopeptidase N/puromycin-sensitive aminopeptidase